MRMQGRPLAKFIDRLVLSMKGVGLPASPEQIIDANEIAVTLLSRGHGEVESDDLKYALAPIFCIDTAEQDTFYRHFDDGIAAPGINPAPLPDDDSGPKPGKPRKPKPPGIFRRWQWIRALAAGLTVVGLILTALWLIWEFAPRPVIDTPTAMPDVAPLPADPQGGAALQNATEISNEDVAFQPPPRPPAPVELLRGQQPRVISSLIWLIITIPVILGIAALMRRIAGRRVFLSADRSRSYPELKSVPIAETRVGLFAYSSLASSVTKMRMPKRRETRRLDARKTVDKTARSGGYPSLVFETQSKRPGYVLMIERKNAFDFFAHASKSLADFLYGAGLEVYAYAFKGRPFRLTPLWRKGNRVTYQEILQRYHGDALVLAGDPGTIRRGDVAGANPWQPDASAWTAMGLLSSNASETWDQQEDWFLEKNFSVAEFGSAGFEDISSWLASQNESRGEPQFAWLPNFGNLYPRVLADDPDRWLDELEQSDQGRMFEQLSNYLGDDGMFLLAAIAAYPELRWPIARFLNQDLFDGEEEAQRTEQRLLRIARLPWCREGTMPDYIRVRILSTLSNKQREDVQVAFYKLLNDSHRRIAGGPAVDIAVPGPKSLQQFLTQMLSTAPPGPYRDYIFQSVMLDKPKDMLGIEMEKRHAKQIGSQRWSDVFPDLLSAGRRTALITVGVAFVAFSYLKPFVTDAIEDRNLLQNANVAVRLLYRSETDAVTNGTDARATEYLARRMKWALESRGFSVNSEAFGPSQAQLQSMLAQAEPPALPVSTGTTEHALNKPIEANFVAFDAQVGVSIVNHQLQLDRNTFFGRLSTPMQEFSNLIADQLRYATYSQPVQFGDSANSAAFDQLLLSVQHDFSMSFANGEIVVVLVEDSRSFQDRLEKGGLGPVMTLIAPGSITRTPAAAPPTRDPNQFRPVTTIFDRLFAFGKFEVTFAEYDRFADITGRSRSDDEGFGRGELPVINVSKADAEAYAEWLSDATGEVYRLPTDSEWEYAARADTPRDFVDPVSSNDANFGSLLSDDEIIPDSSSQGGPLVVGTFAANNWGLHDMQGNVAEWVSDCWSPDPGESAVVLDDGSCLANTIRNGGWRSAADVNHLGSNRSADPGAASDQVGFRLLREVADLRERQPARSQTLDSGSSRVISLNADFLQTKRPNEKQKDEEPQEAMSE